MLRDARIPRLPRPAPRTRTDRPARDRPRRDGPGARAGVAERHRPRAARARLPARDARPARLPPRQPQRRAAPPARLTSRAHASSALARGHPARRAPRRPAADARRHRLGQLRARRARLRRRAASAPPARIPPLHRARQARRPPRLPRRRRAPEVRGLAIWSAIAPAALPLLLFAFFRRLLRDGTGEVAAAALPSRPCSSSAARSSGSPRCGRCRDMAGLAAAWAASLRSPWIGRRSAARLENRDACAAVALVARGVSGGVVDRLSIADGDADGAAARWCCRRRRGRASAFRPSCARGRRRGVRLGGSARAGQRRPAGYLRGARQPGGRRLLRRRDALDAPDAARRGVRRAATRSCCRGIRRSSPASCSRSPQPAPCCSRLRAPRALRDPRRRLRAVRVFHLLFQETRHDPLRAAADAARRLPRRGRAAEADARASAIVSRRAGGCQPRCSVLPAAWRSAARRARSSRCCPKCGSCGARRTARRRHAPARLDRVPAGAAVRGRRARDGAAGAARLRMARDDARVARGPRR